MGSSWVQTMRQKYDPTAQRWFNHINIVQPFVRPQQFASVASRLNFGGIKPFPVSLVNFAHFATNKDFILFLEPNKEGKEEMVRVYSEVCRALDLDANSVRPYAPHLTVGRFQSESELESAVNEHQAELAKSPISFTLSEVVMASRGRETPFEENFVIPLGGGEPRLVKEARAPAQDSAAALYVGNLPYSATVEDLRAIFPTSTDAVVATDHERRSKGFAFVKFASENDMQNCFEECQRNGPELGGRSLRIALRERRQ